MRFKTVWVVKQVVQLFLTAMNWLGKRPEGNLIEKGVMAQSLLPAAEVPPPGPRRRGKAFHYKMIVKDRMVHSIVSGLETVTRGFLSPSGGGWGRKNFQPASSQIFSFIRPILLSLAIWYPSLNLSAQPCTVCPQIEAIMVDACGTEQDNEFVIINSGSGFNTSNLQLDYDANNNIIAAVNNDINTNNGNILADPTPCGLQPGPVGSIIGCSNLVAVGPGVDIPANSIVVLFTSSNTTATYNFDNLCGSGQCVYVIASSCARSAGGFTNAGAGTRTSVLSINGCACTHSVTYNQALLIGGNGAYFVPNGSPQYGNGGCSSPPGITAPFSNDLDDIANVTQCGDYTLPAITGTGLTGNEAYFTDPNGAGTQFSAGQVISANQMLFIYDPTVPCSDQEVFTIAITTPTTPTLTAIGPFCVSDAATGLNTTQSGITGAWSGPGVSANSFNPATAGAGAHTLTFTPNAGQCANPNTIPVSVTALTIPVLTPVGPLCVTNSAVALNTTQSGVTGAWSGPGVAGNSFDPATAGVGAHTLTFTPSAGQCAGANTTSVNVTDTAPTGLTPIGPFCSTAASTALNTTQSGIPGTWSGPGVAGNNFNPAIAGAGAHTLTFTPNAGQCASTNTLPVTVNAPTTPALTAIGPFCATAAPTALNTTQSGVPGAWSGPGVSANSFNPVTAGAGAHTLTFTPNAGQCANANTLSVTVTAPTVPALTPIGPFCTTAAPTALNTTQSGIPGTWSGPGVSANAFNPATAGAGAHTLTFTPNAGQCAAPNTLSVTVTASTTPVLTPIGPFCANDAPAALNTTQSGIPGTWSGPGVSGNNFNPATAGAGNHTLTFTPNAGQCANANNMQVTVNTVPVANPATLRFCVFSIFPPLADYDLPGTENVINGGTGLQVNWYTDAAGTNPINDITDFSSVPANVFATVFNGQCESNTVPVAVQIEFAPAAQDASAQACDSGNGTAVFNLNSLSGQINGALGITVTFYLDPAGNNPVPNPGAFTATDGIEVYAFAQTATGCRSQTPATVTLNVVNGIDPNAVALEVSPAALCGPGDVVLTFTLPIGGSYTVSYSYSNNDVGLVNDFITTTNGGSTLVNITATTGFYITEVATGSCVTPITPVVLTVPVQQAPDINPIDDVTACGSYTLPPILGTNLTGQEAYHTGPDGSGITYFPGEVVSTSVTLYALDFVSPLCADEEVFQVTITEAPDLTLNGVTAICPGASLNLQNVVLDLNFTGLPITFHSNTPATAGNQLPSTTVSPAANTTYYAYANGGAGCQDILAIPVTLLAQPVAANPGVQQVCDPGGGTAIFDLTALNPAVANGQSVTVSWFTNSAATVPVGNPSGYASAGGTVYATVSNGQCTSQPVGVTLSVAANPSATVANTVNPDCGGGANGSISIAVAGGAPTYTFNWSDDAFDGQQNPTGMAAGDYTVTVTDQNGCTDIASATLSPAAGIDLACGETVQASSPGASDGEAIVVITGGTAPFEVTWTGPLSGMATLPDNSSFFITGLPVGDYNLTLTDSQGCEIDCEFSISSFGCNLVLDAAIVNPSCPGASDGAIGLEIQNALGTITYNWNVDALDGVEDPAGLAAGTYIVTVSDQDGCANTDTLTLTDPPSLILSCAQNAPATGLNNSDGSAAITFGGGTAPYTLDFTGPVNLTTTAATAGNGSVFPGFLPGDYTLVLTDANGCSETCAFTINGPGCFVEVTAAAVNPACAGADNGSISLNVSNASGNLTVNWNVDALDGQLSPTGLAPGLYSVTVTDANNCMDEISATLTDPPALLLNCAQQSPVTMVGATDGIADITLGGGTAPYTLSWTGPQTGSQTVTTAGTANISALAAGSYNLTLTDANNCILLCSFTINSPNCAMTLAITGTDVTCPGADDGSIDLTINNGNGPFAIDWNAPGLDAIEDPDNLAPGAYIVTVTDVFACSATASVNIGTSFALPTVSISGNGNVCESECFSFNFSLTGTPPFSLDYLVDDGTNSQNLTLTINQNTGVLELCPQVFGLSSGVITATFQNLSDANCSAVLNQTRSFTILPENSSAIVQTLCDGESIIVNGTTYNQANPAGTETVNGTNGCDSTITINLAFHPVAESSFVSTLCPGETLTVGNQTFDENNPVGTVVLPGAAATGCDSTVTVDLAFFAPSVNPVISTLCPGESIIVNGITYDQANPAGTEILTGQAANGCDSTVTIQLTFFDPVVFNFQETVCDGFTTAVNGTVYDRNNPAGTEVLTGAAANGCDSTINIALTFLDPIIVNIDRTLCPGESLTVNGQVYDATRPAGVEVLPGGSASGCDSTIMVNLDFHPMVVTNISGPLCPGETLTVNGRVYSESDPDGTEILTAATGCDSVVVITLSYYPGSVNAISQTLCSGQSLTVNGQIYDENNPSGELILPGASATGCDSIIRVNLDFMPVQTAGLSASGPICPGGTAVLTLNLAGISGTIDLVWSGGGQDNTVNGAVNGQTFNVSPGESTTYSITSIAVQGSACPVDISNSLATVAVSDLRVDLEATTDFGGFPVSCQAAFDGRIQASASGGVAPVHFSWNGGDSGPFLAGLGPGTYSVTATDAAGCTGSSEIELSAPPAITADLSGVAPQCQDENSGQIIIQSITGGVGPYEYSLDGLFFQVFNGGPLAIANLKADAYTVVITDQNDCGVEFSVAVEAAEELVLDLGPDQTIRLGESAQLNALVNFEVESLTWSPTDSLQTPDGLVTEANPSETTIYTLTAEAAGGCKVSDKVTVIVNKQGRVFIPSVFTPDGDGNNDTFTVFGAGEVARVNTFKIFDRWGNLLFSAGPFPPNDPSLGWNGEFDGRPMNAGVYVFFAEVEYLDGRTEVFKGDVALMR